MWWRHCFHCPHKRCVNAVTASFRFCYSGTRFQEIPFWGAENAVAVRTGPKSLVRRRHKDGCWLLKFTFGKGLVQFCNDSGAASSVLHYRFYSDQCGAFQNRPQQPQRRCPLSGPLIDSLELTPAGFQTLTVTGTARPRSCDRKWVGVWHHGRAPVRARHSPIFSDSEHEPDLMTTVWTFA